MRLMGTALLLCTLAAAGCGTEALKKDKQSSAERNLQAIQRGAAAVFTEKGAFPIGKVGPTPPGSCCNEPPAMKCAPMTAYWDDPVWVALSFSVDDADFFRYGYESADGKSFTAKAIGDLDCDMNEIEFVLTGTSDGGKPTFSLASPTKAD